jgi:hypothetical protein
MKTNKKTWKDYVPESVTLCYVDYDDNLNTRTKLQQQCLSKNSLDDLYKKELEWFDRQIDSSLEQEMKDIQFRMEEDGMLQDYHDNRENIEELLNDRDDSNVIKDLIKNTRNEIMFYSTGVEINDIYGTGAGYYELLKEEMKVVKKTLGIKSEQFDDKIRSLIQNAGYGGELRIYFNQRFDTFITDTDKDFESVRFHGNVNIAIANSNNGSGDCIALPIDIILPFKRENIFIDREVKYSFAHEVCGMCGDYGKDTIVVISFTPAKNKKPAASKITKIMEQEHEYDKIFKSGKCSLFDMDIRRHRNIIYQNSYPCGNKCMDCGTFWVN